uniref:exodeoxyribonuclease VII large subunit n=1 Tax=Eubacterium cellulosolvens TaxID=29322 RepID=UPI00047FF1B3|nr:exodeoxyribonuclease VII large subunit [[Eubacterium] cellulosolvens]
MNKVYSVGQVNAHIRGIFEQDFALSNISISGEISNCTYHRSGHIYFTLKDENSQLSCVMFAGDRRGGLGFSMKNGDKVVVTGSVEVYIRDGKYQLYAKKIELQGAGLLYERFLALKKELEEMGMFAPEYKQPIPQYVKRLGIVTAPTGAAVRDIQNISLRRNPYIQLILYPALVQGEGAAPSIVRGIETLDAAGVDCIIVGRGGGSIEDLWAFNEEAVARAIFDCRTPVISAVGHETDTTIADFVADLRAPTPSAAAELAVCDIREILKRYDAYREKMTSDMRRVIDLKEWQYKTKLEKIRALRPSNLIREKRLRLDTLEDRLRERSGRILEENRRRWNTAYTALYEGSHRKLENEKHRLELLIGRMDGASPIRKLRQGFSYVETGEGKNVSSVAAVTVGESLKIRVTDGTIRTEITGIEEEERVTGG